MVSASRPHMPGYSLAPADGGNGLLPFEWAEERLAKSRNVWLSTVKDDGAPHAMAVWGIWFDGAFWFNTGAKSRKTRNLAGDPRCVVTTESADECVVLEGTAARVEDAEQLARFFAVYEEKYDWDLSETNSPTFRVEPRVVFAFCEAAEAFVNSATRWTFGD